MSASPRYARFLGKPDSEEAALADAVAAIVDTLDTIRTRVNANASISAGDITAFKVLKIGTG